MRNLLALAKAASTLTVLRSTLSIALLENTGRVFAEVQDVLMCLVASEKRVIEDDVTLIPDTNAVKRVWLTWLVSARAKLARATIFESVTCIARGTELRVGCNESLLHRFPVQH